MCIMLQIDTVQYVYYSVVMWTCLYHTSKIHNNESKEVQKDCPRPTAFLVQKVFSEQKGAFSWETRYIDRSALLCFSTILNWDDFRWWRLWDLEIWPICQLRVNPLSCDGQTWYLTIAHELQLSNMSGETNKKGVTTSIGGAFSKPDNCDEKEESKSKIGWLNNQHG